MDQQDQGPGASRAPGDTDASPRQAPQADDAAGDSTWGVGAASAMEHLRRHDYRARRSKLPEPHERPQSE